MTAGSVRRVWIWLDSSSKAWIAGSIAASSFFSLYESPLLFGGKLAWRGAWLGLFFSTGGGGFFGLLPGFKAGIEPKRACSIEAENAVGNLFEQVPIVGDEDDGTGEFEQAGFENVERGDIEVVGRLIEKENVGGG